MSKNKNTAKTTKAKAEKPAPEAKPEATAKPAAAPRRDVKGEHRAAAITAAKTAYAALANTGSDILKRATEGTATEADYKALKAVSDAFKVAVNSLGCHFQAVKEAKAAKA